MHVPLCIFFFLQIDEHFNTRSIRFNYIAPKIKGFESTFFFTNANQDLNLLPDLQMFKKEVKYHLKYVPVTGKMCHFI
jgi:hypothetical protein